jgi:hypothetical protein
VSRFRRASGFRPRASGVTAQYGVVPPCVLSLSKGAPGGTPQAQRAASLKCPGSRGHQIKPRSIKALRLSKPEA